jgi:DNA-binding NtrC family response regulator
MQGKILIVDDERKMRRVLSSVLESEGYKVEVAADGKGALAQLAEFDPDLILLDLKMPGMDGMQTLGELQKAGFRGNVVILTAYGTIPSAVQAVHSGAYDFLTKTSDTEEILLTIKRALEQVRLERRLAEAETKLSERFSIKGIITRSSQMERLLELVAKVAPTDVSVLISGESGTGKELFARAIHQHSGRKDGPFVALNCGAIPETLIESELFGHGRGAFTGAVQSKAGLVKQADGGTLFLDEIGEMGLEAQVKLLRFAQSGEYIPVGEVAPRSVDVRLIAASNADLEQAIEQGRFRSDLYYRLNVVSIGIPPLRERPEDIPPLIEHFLFKLGMPMGLAGYKFTPEALTALQLYNWPGNVRELENAVNSALVMAEQSPVGVEYLPARLRGEAVTALQAGSGSLPDRITQSRESVERTAIVEALSQTGYSMTKAAKKLGISRTTLFRRMRQYMIPAKRKF